VYDVEPALAADLVDGLRVRVWSRRFDVVASADGFTFWPIGLVRRVPDPVESSGAEKR
jgi:hypothetical protein